MGAYLSAPVTEKESSDGASEQFVWGCSAMQGWRKHQEDAHLATPALPTKPDVACFGATHSRTAAHAPLHSTATSAAMGSSWSSRGQRAVHTLRGLARPLAGCPLLSHCCSPGRRRSVRRVYTGSS